MKWISLVISFWLAFVLSLAGWWLYFGVRTLNQVGQVSSETLAKHQTMLFYEGAVLMAFLLAGGLALFYLSFRMYREKTAKENFFGTFAHDLKTSLFRLQLQIEKLGKNVSEDKIAPVLGQTRKLQMDLENSLDYSLGEGKSVYLEPIEIKIFLSELHAQWPELHFRLKGEANILGDRKGMNSIFKNLLHNSCVHGKASQIEINIVEEGKNVVLTYKDDGDAFEGDIKALGKDRINSTEGTGFGLFLVRHWIEKMKGQLYFSKSQGGQLQIQMKLPKVV